MKFNLILLALVIPFFINAQDCTTTLGDGAGVNINVTYGFDNTFIGCQSGNSNTTGNSNTFIGSKAGQSGSGVGLGNTYVGYNAGNNNTAEGGNTFIGVQAGAESAGAQNTFIGTAAGSTAFGNNNIFMGLVAGGSSQGNNNVFIGGFTGTANNANNNTSVGSFSGAKSTGSDNAFFGMNSGENNTSGAENTFIGSESGADNTTAKYNTFVGKSTGTLNDGDKNTFLGHIAGKNNGKGALNTFVGTGSGTTNSNGRENTFIGVASGFLNVGGHYNTFVGRLAGKLNQWGTNNTYLGHRAGEHNRGSRNVFIGNDAGKGIVNTSDKLIISNVETNTPLIYGDFVTKEATINGFLEVTGQLRTGETFVKTMNQPTQENARTINNALQKIKQINGVTYLGKTANERTANTEQMGFVAEDLEKVLPELVAKDEDEIFYVNYDGFVPVIVEAMKEQEKVISSQAELIENQEKQIADLVTRMSNLENSINAPKMDSPNNIDKAADGVVLKQNTPNPASQVTTITYEIPQIYKAVSLNIYDMNGKILLTESVNGKTSSEIDISTFTNGTYIYTLVANDKVIATQKMIVKK